MTDALRAPQPTTCRRVVGPSGVGLVLAVATVAAGAAPAQADDYTVRPGDTVSQIARRTSTSVAQLTAANKLDARATIRAGQTLVIPSAAATPPAAPAPPTAVAYTVVAGDTVSGVALRHSTTVAAIVAANGLDARATIRIGQVLSIATGASGAAPATPAAAVGASRSYAVQAGDTVSALAARFGTTTAAIVAANGLDARATIRIGQVLSVPGAAAVQSQAAAPAAPPSAATHTVVRGETVSALAARYGTTSAVIVAANGLADAAMIRIGQVLTIPGVATVPLVGATFAGRTYPAATVDSANANKATLLAMGVPSRADMQAMVASTARAMGVDPALAQAIAYQESGFNHTSVSPANAIGTMQVIPSSGRWASDLVGRDLNLLDPQDNVTAGVAILRQLVTSADDLPMAIAGYYQGLAGVRQQGMYADTRRYVASVRTLMSRYA